MRRVLLLTTICASVLAIAGCALTDHVAGTLGGALGTRAAQALPSPPAAVRTDPKGGTFCDTLARLGWPLRLTAKDVDTVSGGTLRVIVATDEHGANNCGWKAGG